MLNRLACFFSVSMLGMEDVFCSGCRCMPSAQSGHFLRNDVNVHAQCSGGGWNSAVLVIGLLSREWSENVTEAFFLFFFYFKVFWERN